MVTAIVRSVRQALREGSRAKDVTIVFPVAADAVAVSDDLGLGVVPGVQAGEGCSLEGGCATCPYMKMNSLSALHTVLSDLNQRRTLAAYAPKRHDAESDAGSLFELGTAPIMAMRHFQEHGVLPSKLVRQVHAKQAG